MERHPVVHESVVSGAPLEVSSGDGQESARGDLHVTGQELWNSASGQGDPGLGKQELSTTEGSCLLVVARLSTVQSSPKSCREETGSVFGSA